MKNTISSDYVTLYSLNEDRKSELEKLLKDNPKDPFLHFWYIIENTNSYEKQNNDEKKQKKIQESIALIFKGKSAAALFARSALLYQGNQSVIDYANKTYYFDRFTNQVKSDKILQEVNDNFAENYQLSISDPRNLPIIYGFYGLKKAAKEGYIPASFELATGHYRWQALAENSQHRDLTTFYYKQLKYLNQCKNFAPAEVEKIFLLLEAPPIFNEYMELVDAEALLERCKAIPVTQAHETYAQSIECYNFDFFTSNSREDQSQLLGDTALKLALNYFQFLDQLIEDHQDSKTINFFEKKANQQLEIAVREGNVKAKVFQAYLLVKKPFGDTVVYKNKLHELLKDIKSEKHLTNEINYFGKYQPLMKEAFDKLQQRKDGFLGITEGKLKESYYNEALRLSKAAAKKIAKTPSEILSKLLRRASPSVEWCTSHPLQPDLQKVMHQDNEPINAINSTDAFKTQLAKLNTMYLKQKATFFFKANSLGDQDTFLLITLQRNLAKTTHTDAEILQEIERITTFNGHPLYDTNGDLANIINNLYASLNQTKPPPAKLEPHILHFWHIIEEYNKVANHRHRQFTDPQRINAVFILLQILKALADNTIGIKDFYKSTMEVHKLYPDGHLGDMLFKLCDAVKIHIAPETAQQQVRDVCANEKPQNLQQMRL